MGQKVVKDSVDNEIADFVNSTKCLDNLQPVTTSSALNNAMEFAALTSSLINSIKQYQNLIRKDALKISTYVEGLRKADSK